MTDSDSSSAVATDHEVPAARAGVLGELAGRDELATLGRTTPRRCAGLLRPPRLVGPTEAINDRLEALRRNARGFRNLINYRIRSLMYCGALAL